MEPSKFHYHKIPGGVTFCWHKCQSIVTSKTFWVSFVLGNTMTFPLEHFLWEHVWPFAVISRLLGL